MRALQFVVFMFVSLSPLAVALGLALAPLPYGPVAAVFPPWWSAREAVAAAAAAGAVIRVGALPSVVIVASPDRSRLQSRGAWLLLDPRAAGFCSTNVNPKAA